MKRILSKDKTGKRDKIHLTGLGNETGKCMKRIAGKKQCLKSQKLGQFDDLQLERENESLVKTRINLCFYFQECVVYFYVKRYTQVFKEAWSLT